MHCAELHRTGAKSSVALQLSKNNVKQSCCTRHSCQGRNLFSTVSHLEFALSSNSSSNFSSFRRFRLGKETRDALEKKSLNGRWRWQSGIQFAKEKLDGWEAMKAVQRVWGWFSKISKTFYCHPRITKLRSPISTCTDQCNHCVQLIYLNLVNLFNFKSRDKRYPEISVHLDGRSIKQVSHVKFLGVYLDELLNWTIHISNISNKVAKILAYFAN